MIAQGSKIRWRKVWGSFEQPAIGEIGHVTEVSDDSPLFMVMWPDGSVSVESEQDRNDYWEEV